MDNKILWKCSRYFEICQFVSMLTAWDILKGKYWSILSCFMQFPYCINPFSWPCPATTTNFSFHGSCASQTRLWSWTKCLFQTVVTCTTWLRGSRRSRTWFLRVAQYWKSTRTLSPGFLARERRRSQILSQYWVYRKVCYWRYALKLMFVRTLLKPRITEKRFPCH